MLVLVVFVAYDVFADVDAVYVVGVNVVDVLLMFVVDDVARPFVFFLSQGKQFLTI